MIWFRLEQSISKFGTTSRIKLIYCPTELILAYALTQELSEVKFPIFTTLTLIQDTRLDQSERVEDQVTPARLWLKQAHVR